MKHLRICIFQILRQEYLASSPRKHEHYQKSSPAAQEWGARDAIRPNKASPASGGGHFRRGGSIRSHLSRLSYLSSDRECDKHESRRHDSDVRMRGRNPVVPRPRNGPDWCCYPVLFRHPSGYASGPRTGHRYHSPRCCFGQADPKREIHAYRNKTRLTSNEILPNGFHPLLVSIRTHSHLYPPSLLPKSASLFLRQISSRY